MPSEFLNEIAAEPNNGIMDQVAAPEIYRSVLQNKTGIFAQLRIETVSTHHCRCKKINAFVAEFYNSSTMSRKSNGFLGRQSGRVRSNISIFQHF